MSRKGAVAGVLALMLGGLVWAQEANAAVPAEDITSMKGQATITIEGKADIAIVTSRVKDWSYDAGIGSTTYLGRRGDRWNITDFGPDKMDLTFKVDACDNAWLITTLALDDAWNANGSYDQDQLLKEMYFVFDNLWCTGLGVKFGKQALPFGYDKDELFVHPYLDGYGNSALTKIHNRGWSPEPQTGLLGKWFEAHPTTVDRVFAITPYYNLGDKLEFAFSVAQVNRQIGWNRKSKDDMLFKTMAAQVFWKPIENLILQASAITMYDVDGKGLSVQGNRFGTRSFATSLSADYTFQIACRPFNVFAEWMHGWRPVHNFLSGYMGDTGYYRNSSSDDFHVGIAYNFTDALKVLAQGEWLRQRQNFDYYGRNAIRETMWRYVLAAQYEMSTGMVLEAGYQYERGKERARIPAVNAWARDRSSANTFFAGVHWSF